MGPSMCRRSFQVNSFVEKAYVALATRVCETHAWWGEKRQKDAKGRVRSRTVCVEKSERVSAEAGECEWRSRRV